MGLRMRYYSAPDSLGVRSIVMSVYVCLSLCVSVCLSVHDHVFGTTLPIFTNFFIHVTYRSGSVIFWRRNDMLRIFGLWMT